MKTIEMMTMNEQVEILDVAAQAQVLGGMAYLTDSIREREASIRTVEIFRLEIE